MSKHKITIDANDISGGADLAAKISNGILGGKIDFNDFDRLFNQIDDMGNGICIIIKNAGKLPKDAIALLNDSLAHSSGLEVILEYGDGHTERRASATGANVQINITAGRGNGGKPKNGGWWDVFYSLLVKVFLWIMALGVVYAILTHLYLKSK